MSLSEAARVGYVVFAPIFLIGAYIVCLKVKGLRGGTRDIVLLLVFLVGTLFFAYARQDFIHFQPALPFASIAIVYFLRKLNLRTRIAGGLLYIVFGLILLSRFYGSFDEGGKVLFFGEFEENVALKVMEVAEPGESVFAFGTTPHLNFLTNTLPPGRVFVFQFPWFMVEAEERILDGLKNDPPKVVLRDRTARVGGVLLISQMDSIDKYIEENYKMIDSVGKAEILVSKD